MVPRQTVKTLAERKQLLVAQCQAHRVLLQLEREHLRASLHWVAPVGKIVRAARSHGWVVGAVAGLLVARRGRSLLQWLIRGVQVWRQLRPFIKS